MGTPIGRTTKKWRKRMNFNEKNIIPIHAMTLKNMREFLATLPKECDEWEISCCGCTDCWVHLSETGQAITIDTEECIE